MAVAKYVGISSTGRDEDNELYSDKEECIYNQWLKYQQNKSVYKNTANCYTIKLSEINSEGPLNATRYIWKPQFQKNVGKITDIADIISDKITPSSEENEYSNFALIRMDELQNNPVKVESIIYCLGSEIEGSLKIIQEGDILLARLGPSMLNRKIVVVPPIENKVDYFITSPEFIVIRPKNREDSYYITGVLRTDLMLRYMYSKTRGGTPSRYRLNEDDFKEIDFPMVEADIRREKAISFKKSLVDYDNTVKQAEDKLIQSHQLMESDL